MFNDEGTTFFVNSKDLKLEGLGTNMSYEMGSNIYDFDYEILRHYDYEFLIFFKEVGTNEFIETFTGTKYYSTDDNNVMVSEDSLVTFSVIDMVDCNWDSCINFINQCERTPANQFKRKMNKVYKRNRKAYKKNSKSKVLEKIK